MANYISASKITEDYEDKNLNADTSGNEEMLQHQDKSMEQQKLNSSDAYPRQDTFNSASEPNRSQNK